MSSLSKKTLERIANGRVSPISRWKFLLLSGMKWVAASLVSVLAAFGIMLTVHVLFEIDWDVYRELGFTWFEVFQSLSPLLWTALIAAMLISGVTLLRQTKYGYRYSLASMFGLIFLSGMTMGATFEHWPGEEQIESALMYKIPGYRNFEANILPSVEKQWSQPEDGLLGGTITSIDEGESFQLRDFEDKSWKIETRDALMSESVDLKENQEIKIIGETGDDETFHAAEFRSWESEKQPIVRVKSKTEKSEKKEDREEEGEEDKEEQEESEADEDENEEKDEDEQEQEESEADN